MTRDEQSLKRTYKVWWDYLKLSIKYKDFYKLMSRAKGKSGREHFDILASINNLEWARKDHPDFSDPWDMTKSYFFFGNVYRQQFDTWWEKNKGVFMRPVFEFSDPDALVFIELQLSDTYRYLRKYDKNYIPKLVDIVKMFTKDNDYFYFGIPKEGMNANDISKEITRIKDKLKKQPASSKINDPFRHPMPIGKAHLVELEKYLEIYQKRLKKGLSITDIIIEKEGVTIREKKGELQHLQSEYSDYVEKARRIIKNVEKGCFPGTYSRERKK